MFFNVILSHCYVILLQIPVSHALALNFRFILVFFIFYFVHDFIKFTLKMNIEKKKQSRETFENKNTLIFHCTMYKYILLKVNELGAAKLDASCFKTRPK